MKPAKLLRLLPLFILASPFAQAENVQLDLMTYNIRLDIQSDGPNQWGNRKEQVAAQIGFLRPDVLGIQEGLANQVAFLDNTLADYSYVGVGRDDAEESGEFSALFYHTDTVEVLASSTFWLSDTPEIPSFGWGARYRRVCTYARLRDKRADMTYWVFNTHMDHQVPAARLNGARLILDRIDQLVPEGEVYFLMGDLNASPDSPPIELISETMNNAREHCTGPVFGSHGTYNDFEPSHVPERRIDYIFTSGENVTVDAYATFSDLVDLRYPSDHFPVMIRCTLAQ